MKKTCLHILILGTACVAAADRGFEPYQSIIERMPFGRSAAELNSDATEMRAQANDDGQDVQDELAVDTEQEKIAEDICATVRVCALNVPPGGKPVVGFTDSAYTPPRSHLLSQGQSADGWTALEIDAASCRAVLERDGVAVSFRLGGGQGEVEAVGHRVQQNAKTASPPPRKETKHTRKHRKSRKSKSPS